MKNRKPMIRAIHSVVTLLVTLTMVVPVNLLWVVTADASTSERVVAVEALHVPRVGHTATVLADGSVLVAGGENTGGILDSVEIFVPGTNAFVLAGNLTTARIGHSATLLSDGRVLIAGGNNSGGPLNSAEIYDPATRTAQAISPMTSARTGHTATKMLDGKVLLAGGDATGTAELFDPTTGTFTALGNLAEPRTGHSATLFADNSVLLAGGGTNSAEYFDPTNLTFTLVPQAMTATRTGQAALATADEKLLLVGGDAANTIEQFDPATESFALTAALSNAVTTATLLANENILVLGPDAAGVFAPAGTNQWEALTDTNAVALLRTGQTATELPATKQILVVGGRDSSNELVSVAALFNPAQIATDQDDYPPFSFVDITGAGFLPGETVTNQVTQIEGPAPGTAYDAWETVADTNGNFTTTWLVFTEDLLGTLLELTSKGQTSGLTVQTRFKDNKSLTVSSAGSGSGAITSTDGFINCGSTCSHSYGNNADVTLTATPNSGSVVASWNVNGATINSGCGAGSTTCSINLNGSARNVVVTFNTVTATKIRVETMADGSGIVVPAQGVCSGSSITVYAIARDGSDVFAGNVAATWSLTNKTGSVVNGDLAASGDTKSATFTGHSAGTAAIDAASGSLTKTDSGTITVNTTPGAPTGNATATFCSAASHTIADLATAASVSGSSIQWYAAASGGSALAGATTLVNGTTYYASQTSAQGCESTARLAVAVTVNTTPGAPTGNATATFCSAASHTIADLATAASVSGSSIQWYAAASGGSALAGATTLVNGTTYYASQTSAQGCESTARLAVAVTVNTTPGAPTGNATATFCSAASHTIADLATAASVSGNSIQWYSAASGGSALAGGTTLVNSTTYYASQTSAQGCESTARLAVAATVNTTPSAPTASAQSFCSAASPTVANLVATGSGGTLKWYNVASGGSALSGATALSSGTYYVSETSAQNCESSRTPVSVTVNATKTATAGGPDTVCQSATPSPITLSGASVGGSATTGAWSITAGGGSLSSTAQTATPATVTYTPAANFTGTVTLTLTTDATGPCGAVTATRTINVNATKTATAGGPDTVCQSATPSAITLSGASVGGSAATGAWSITAGGGSLSSTAQTATPATVTYTPAANFTGTVTLTLTTDATAPCGAVSATRTINVNATKTVTPGGPDTVCQSASPSPITLSGASVGGSATTGAWSINGAVGGSLSSTAQTATPASVTYTPAANFSGTVTLTLTTDATGPCSAVTAIRTINVNATKTATAGGPDTVCQSASPSAITLSGASVGGSAATGAWSITAGGGSLSSTAQTATPATVTCTPAANFSGTVTLTLTTDASAPCGAVTATRTINVNATKTATAGGPDTVCQSATPSAITLSGASVGGSAATGAWSITAGGGSLSSTAQTATPATVTYTPAANFTGTVTLTLTTDATAPCGAVSATRTINVNATKTATAGGPDTVCQSATPSAITLSGASVGGSATTGAWSITAGGGSLSSTAQTATPATVTYTPAANFSGTVTLTLTTDATGPCGAVTATRTINVNATKTATAGGPDTVCQSASPSAITLSGASVGGSAATGAWSITAGGGSLSSTAQTATPATVTYTPAANFSGTVTLTLTTDATAPCGAVTATRTINVNATKTATAGGPDTVCQSATPSAITLSGASVGGSATTGAWSINAGGGSLSSTAQTATPAAVTYTPAANFSGTVTLTLTTDASGPCGAVTATRTINVNATPSAPTGTAAQSFCSGSSPTVASLTATGTAILWYAAASGGSPLASSTALVNGTHYYASQTVNGCESTSRFDVTATVNATPSAPTGTAAQSFCLATSPTVASLTATGTSIQWYAAASGGSPLASGTALATGTYYASQTVGGCESSSRFNVTVTVTTTPGAPTGSAAQSFCSASSPTVASLTATGTSIQWYAAASGGSPLAAGTALATGTYYASQTVGGCESTARFAVTVTVTTTPGAPTGSAAQSFCSGSSPTVASLTATGTSIQWYAAASGGSPLAAGTALATGTYYASQTVGGCESTARFAVTVTVTTTPGAPTGTAAQSFCSGSSPTVASLTATGTSIQWYAAASGGSPLATSTALVNGTHYYASQTVNGCESNSRFNVTVTVTTTPAAPTGTASQTFCSGGSPTVASLTATGTAILWYAAAGGGSPLASSTALINGTHYYASQTVNGCESTSRFDVTATVNTTPTTSVITGNSPVCAGTAGVTYSVTATTGSSYAWTVPTGATITAGSSGPNNNQITVTFGSTSGNVTVTETSAAGCVGSQVTKAVTVSAAPTTSAITGSSSVCAGTAGVTYSVTATSGSSYAWTVPTGATITAGSTGPNNNQITVTFGSTSGNVTVTETSAAGCAGSQVTKAVTVNALPTAYAVTGGGAYCSGGSGVAVGLSGSDSGVSYHLYTNSTFAVGSWVAGTGSAITFGSQTGASTYTVLASNTTSGCTQPMSGSQTVTVNALPTQFSVTGGGAYCSGGSGVAVGLSGSQSGVSYQLYTNSTFTVGAAVAGTGSAISFGNQTGAGTYTVTANNTTTGCTQPMSGNATVTLNTAPSISSQPTAQTVCAGSAATYSVTAAGTGLSYQWRKNGANLSNGGTIAGATAASLSVTPGSTSDTVTAGAGYDCVVSGACTPPVTSTRVALTVNDTPTVSMPADQTTCVGSTVSFTVTATGGGLSYQWLLNGQPISNGPTGNGSTYSGATTATLTISNTQTGDHAAHNKGFQCQVSNSCGTALSATPRASLDVNSPPTAYSVTGGGSYCSGGGGVAVGLSGSDSGITYQLQLSGVNTGSPVAGTGSALAFGSQTGAGTYTVVATPNGTSCTASMTGSATVTVNALPTAYAVTGGGAYCAGGSGVAIGLANSQTGKHYQLYRNGGATTVGSSVAGTGGAISFGNQTTADTYTVVATDDTTSCTANMTGNATVTVNALPTTSAITGSGSVCAGTAGVTYSVTATTGSSYAWTVPSGATITAGGSGPNNNQITVTFGSTSGNVTVTETSAAGCAGSQVTKAVTVNATPTTSAITGSGSVCAGTAGVTYSVTATSGSSYAWTVPSGATITAGSSGPNNNQITVTFGSTSGNVTVTETSSAGCVGSQVTKAVTVNTAPAQPGAITGSAAVCAGASGVAYSIGAVSGATGYTWSVPSGASVASGQGSTAISVNWGSANSGNVSVSATNSCGSSSAQNLATTVNTAPVTPGTITGSAAVCSGASGVAYSISAVSGATGYTWSVPSGALVASGQGSTAISVNWAAASSGNVAVSATNSCGSSSAQTLAVTVNALPTASAISGNSSVCAGAAGVTYSVTATSGSSYAWTVPAGAAITSGNTGPNNNQITVTFGNTSGNVTVTETSAAGCVGSQVTEAVTVSAAPTTSAITGSALVCAGTAGVTYSVTATTGSSYAWTVPTGATITAGSTGPNNNQIAVTFGSTSGNVTVTETSAAGCVGSLVTKAVTVNATPTTSAITGNALVCAGTAGVTYSVTATTGSSYAWTVPTGATITAGSTGPNNNQIAVTFGSTSGSVTVTETSAAGCVGSQVTKAVTVNTPPAQPGAITGSATVCAGASGVSYSISAVGGVTGYTWSVPSGASVASGQGTTAITVNWGTASSGNVSVTADDTCGSSPASNLTVTVNALPSISGQPSDATVYVGDTATFTVAASGSGINLQWQKNGVNLSNGGTVSGATTTTLTLTGVGSGDSGATFDCVVSGTCPPAATSRAALLTVNLSPTIIAQPASVAKPVGTGAAFSVAAIGKAPLNYQWRKNGAAIAGATSSSLTIATVTPADAATYDVVVRDVGGQQSISSGATLLADVTAQVTVTRSGYSFNNTTQRFVQTVTVKNNGATVIQSTISMALDYLSSNATLYNMAGTTSATSPAGSAYASFPAASLSQGISTSMTVQFVNPTKTGFTYTPRILAGPGAR